MSKVDALRIKLFLDGAELPAMKEAVASNPLIKGFTTNPTLMRKAGIADFAAFAKEAIAAVGNRSISFEVFSDDFATMEREAREIHSWGGNTYVKIPVTNTKGASSAALVRKLSAEGIALNVTAILTTAQVREVGAALSPRTPSIVSVFAGRIADTGLDPMPLMRECVGILGDRPRAELLWASPRELLNIFQADEVGCHIITATKDVLAKLSLVGKDLSQYSLETVQMFYRDAAGAGYRLVPPVKATTAA
ncbi:MAG: transaldolase [Alphaproteobacteria bacterium]